MCGIACLFAPLPRAEREDIASGMGRLLSHRGPDDAGLYSDDSVPLTLVHRRLSIIDLSPDGHQPMRRGPLWVSYNGEIYNYLELREELALLGVPFQTRSDTEVLLAAFSRFGDQAPERMNGMFALLLWDTERRRLSLVRDRFGVKPLYYLSRPERGIFIAASEPKAVLYAARRLLLPIAVDADALACYLADAATEEGEHTFFAGLLRVPAGGMVALDLAGTAGANFVPRSRTWYALSPSVCPEQAGGEAGDGRFRELLTDAIRLRLRSDVEVGTCLSGGLDSSSLVCLAQLDLKVRPRTFSAVYGPGDPADESRFIDEVAAHAGVANEKIRPEEVFSPEALLRFIDLHDEPIGGTSVWAQHCVFRLARQAGITVMLDGQGADETLTGYHGAFRPLWAGLLRQLALSRLSHELRGAARLHGYRPLWSLLGAGATLLREALPAALYDRYLDRKWRGFFAQPAAPFFRLHAPPQPVDPPLLGEWNRRSLLHGYLYQLTVGSSLQTILRYEDRNSMAASIEARAPFLDYRLVQHCLGRPAADLLEDGYTKALLRRSLRGVLPESVRLRADKIGFATPEGRWLRGPLRPLFQDLLASRSLEERGWFRVAALKAAFARFCAEDGPSGSAKTGASKESYAFWKALNVELWLRHHGLSG